MCTSKNIVTGAPLVVHLLRSDSIPLQPDTTKQVFKLSIDSVIIPVGQTSSNTFEITGNFSNGAVLTARATAYGQDAVTILGRHAAADCPDDLEISTSAKRRPASRFTPPTRMASNGSSRAPLVVSGSSSAPAVANVDSATVTRALRARRLCPTRSGRERKASWT